MGSGMSESVGGNVAPGGDTLSELARLAGITKEDGPGAAMLYSKDKPESITDKMKSGADAVKDFFTKGAEAEAPIATPAVTKADAFKPALDAARSSRHAQSDDKLKEWGDSPLNRIGQPPKPQSPGAAEPFAPRERERVVSPKVDKYDKDLERAEKTRRWIVDRDSPNANDFGRKVTRAIAEPIAAVKSAWHGAQDEWDSVMGNDLAPDPKPPVSVVKKSDWKGDKDNPALKENDELNRMRKIAGLKECGDMGMSQSPMQKDRLNVTTNMSSDGTKDITINAQGERADELLQMLKMAGMRPHDDHSVTMSEPEVIMISSDQMMEDDDLPPWHGITDPELLDNLIQQAKVMDYDNFYDENSRLLDNPGEFWENYHEADGEIDEERETQYSNTPDEEYQSVDSITRQGNDLNREKRQYAGKPRLGDNPMAESVLDQDLNEILESILIRDDNNGPKITRDPETGRVHATYPAPKKPDQSTLPLQTEPYHGPRSLKADGERTGTENHGKEKEVDEGWEDVSNFIGDLVGTEASKLRTSQQLRDLDAMRKQYKGTEWEDQVNKRYDTHLDRLQADKGEVVGKDGEPIKVLPPQQWKGK